MYWHKTPKLVQWLYPNLIWHKSRSNKTLYLTFDDGPIPEVTPEVLKVLELYNAKATFFCVGDNVKKYPEIYKQLLAKGHKVGNHTNNHLNGWKTSVDEYLENVETCKTQMPEASFFRPAYGKIKRRAIKQIINDYQIIMWDVLAGDFDENLNKENCLKNTIEATQNGSIIIFHDSLKAKESALYTLPRFLKHYSSKGYKFETL